jgi:hypothetical protein
VIVVWMVGSMLVGAFLLMVLSVVLSHFKVDGIGPALAANVIALLSWYAYLFIAQPLLLPHLPQDGWTQPVVSVAVLTALLAASITFVPGINADLLSALAAAAIVSVAESALMFVVVPLFGG